MKIILLGTTATSLYLFRTDLIKKLINEGNIVYTGACDFTPATKIKMQTLGAIPFDYSLSRVSLNPFGGLYSIWKLSQTIRKITPDIVISYFIKPVIFGTLAAKIAGVKKTVGMIEGLGHAFTNYPQGKTVKQKIISNILVQLFRITFSLIDKVVFLNSDDKNELVKKYNIKINDYLILGGIGVDLTYYSFQEVNIDKISFLFIGRLLREKGIFEFIEAAKIVKSKYPEVTFRIVGGIDKSNMSSLSEEDIKKLKNNGIVNYDGEIEDVRASIAKTSVFVLPSYREGVPRSSQESLAIGRAIITTDVPGCRETVIDGKNGYLVPPFSPEDLANKMFIFIENPQKISEMGKESLNLARLKFDSIKVNEKLVSYLFCSK